MKNKSSMAFAPLRYFISCLFVIFLVMPVSAWAVIDQDYPSVKLQTLDKATARTKTIIVNVGDTVEFGSLFIKVQSCRKSGPLDQPESAAFLQIWEVPINADKSEWVFSGWMYASSPALSAMDYAVYDVWVLDCVGGEEKPAETNNVTVKIDGVEVDANTPLIEKEIDNQESINSESQPQELEEQDDEISESINSVLENLKAPAENIDPLFSEEQIIE